MKYTGRLTGTLIVVTISAILLALHTIFHDTFMHEFLIISAFAFLIIFWFLGSFLDNIQHKAEELRTRKLELESILDNVDAAIWSYTPGTNVLQVSAGIEKLSGISKEKFLAGPKTLEDVIIPEDHKFIDEIRKVIYSKESGIHEFRIKSTAGELRWVQMFTTPLLDPNGNIIKINAVVTDITQQKSTQEKIFEAEAKYRNLVEQALVGVYIFQDNKLAYVNPKMEEMLGYNAEELYDIDILSLFTPESAAKVLNNLKNIENGVFSITEQLRGFTKSGKTIDAIINATATYYNGSPALIGTILDVTEQTKAVENLQKGQKFLLDVFDAMQDGICVVDRDLNVVSLNRTMEEWYSYLLPMEGKKCYNAYFDRTEPCEGCLCIKAINEKTFQHGKVPFTVKGEMKGWLELYAFPLFDEDGTVTGVIEHLRDITQRVINEEKISHLAYYDDLTGLPNRHTFNRQLQQFLDDNNSDASTASILFMDLDRFKMINDTLGHDWGDAVLEQASLRFKGCVRSDDIVCRYGGDEFVILMKNISAKDVERSARRILDCFSHPFTIDGHDIYTSPSIGISTYPYDGNDAEILIKHADTAMYYAKEHGKNSYKFYDSSQSASLSRRMTLENNLRKAIENNEFILYYQPQVNIYSGEIVGLEALIRWQHPKLGLITPLEFIPLAEETGLIIPISNWVLESACRQSIIWQSEGLPQIHLAVNISGHHFRHKSFTETIMNVLSITGFDPEYLELEVTESIIRNIDELSSTLDELKTRGIKISIDDFGTGYSSLGVLQQLPIDILKIDKSFMKDAAINTDRAALVKTIIDMSNNLNLSIIAEGIEEEDQIEFLKGHKCSIAQGYYFSKPLHPDEIKPLLIKGRIN